MNLSKVWLEKRRKSLRLSAYLWIRFLIAFTISTCRIDIRDNPMTISHCVPSNKVNWNALCSAGINRMHAIRIAEAIKESISQGLIPSARTQIGSVLER